MHLGALTLVLGLLTAPLAGGAQPAGKVHRIGLLWLGAPEIAAPRARLDSLREGMRELGHVEGQTFVLEQRFAQRDDLFADPVKALLREKVDLIVSSNTPAIRAAKQATTTVPIVMAAVGDPIASGLVSNLARPGGNVTGLSIGGTELNTKRLALLKEAVPKLSRVAVLWNPANPSVAVAWAQTEAAARTL